MTSRKHYHVVAAVIEVDGKMLCMQRGVTRYSYTSHLWEFPGGKIEPGETPEQALHRELLEESIGPDGVLADEGLAEGHQLMAFVTRGCPYCRMTREKLGSMAQRHHLDTARIHYYEPADLPDNLFLRITYGQRPFIILLDDGVPVTTYHYRNINERQVSRFLQ